MHGKSEMYNKITDNGIIILLIMILNNYDIEIFANKSNMFLKIVILTTSRSEDDTYQLHKNACHV